MVLACESLFFGESLDGRPRNLHTFSKVNMKYIKCTFPVGQARYSFHLPHSYNLQILLARGNGASTDVEPCLDLVSSPKKLTSSPVLTKQCGVVPGMVDRWHHLILRSL